ncbi:Alpha/Beta hydrolase protein [Aspergillus nidulans var. acristatus]
MVGPSLLQLPWVALAYARPKLRQDPNWTYRQAFTNSLLKAFLRNWVALHLKWYLSVEPRSESDRFVQIPPANPDLYTGIVIDEKIKPETIGATWYPAPYPSPDSSQTALPEGQHVVLHLHGGSYILGDGRTSSCNFLATTLLEHTPSSYILCPQYRLAGNRNGNFPAQLQDTIASYAYLIHTIRVPASQIIVSGDSAGADLALALLRYIIEFDNLSILPAPKCCWLWSPWCDVPAAVDPGRWNHSANYKTDYIPGSFPARGAKLFLKNVDVTKYVEQYVSPVLHPFVVPSPVLIITGDREVLFKDHKKLAQGLKELAQNDELIELFVTRGVPHDVLMIAWIMGFQKEARESAIKAGEFVNRLSNRVGD